MKKLLLAAKLGSQDGLENRRIVAQKRQGTLL